MDAPRFSGFEILETMPQGSMGTVYKARQISLDRIVAIKSLPRELAADSADIDQFLAEARITANLKHPNIVQVYDFGKSEDGVYFFVMEFISGYSVGEWIRRKRLLSEENSLLVAQSVAGALGYAWDKNRVIHCDIKPDNIMIDGDGTVKVADLGLAKSMRSVVDLTKTAAGVVCGTPNYISPEQSLGKEDLDCRTDIYSLGAMLYHCMTGKTPFEGEPLLKVMDLQITDQIPDPQDVNPDISKESAALIEKMMAKDKNDRQPNWEAVQDDIARAMNGQMPSGRLPAEGKSTIRRSAERGRHPRVKAHDERSSPQDVKPQPLHADDTAFDDMARKFEEKQKRRALSRAEWWAALLIGAAVLLLAFLALKSILVKPLFKLTREIARPLATDAISSPKDAERKDSEEPQSGEAPAVATSEDRAARLFLDALSWIEAHPDSHDECMEMLAKVAEESTGTKFSALAQGEIELIREKKQRAIASLLSALDSRAEELGAQKKHGEAARVYEEYDGALAAATAEIRRLRADTWREMQRKVEDDLSKALSTWNQLIQDVAGALVTGDAQKALETARNISADSVPEDKRGHLDELREILSEAALMDERILESFRDQKGREIDVALIGGSEKLTIGEVHDGRVEAEKIVVIGAGHASYPRSFAIGDLADAEIHLRLGADDRPSTALMKGLASIRRGDLKSAENFFAAAGPPLSDALLGEILKIQEGRMEEAARHTLVRLMRSVRIEVPEELPPAADCVAAVRRKTLSPEDGKLIAQAAKAYRKKFEGISFLATYEPVLAALEEMSSDGAIRRDERDRAQPAGETESRSRATGWADDSSVREQLLICNPGLGAENIRFSADYSGRIVAVEIRSPALRDIQPLASLRDLRFVTCSGLGAWENAYRSGSSAALNDISSLKGLALEELVISGTQVRDISALAGMPLAKLDVSNTRVHDIYVLRGLPLKSLDISRTEIRDIRALQGLPLERLSMSGTPVDSILPLRDMRLTWLDMGGTKIRQITGLRGMPLKTLILNDAAINEISSLCGMPLVRLEIAGTQVRDLGPLAGMQLEWLDVGGIALRSLAILKGMPLRVLKADNTRIFDLSVLAGMKLEVLSIARTDVKDIWILRSMPLKRLCIDFTKVDDLSALSGMSLEHLTMRGTGVKDLSPLSGMPLKYLDITETPINNLTAIQHLPIEHLYLDQSHLRYGSGTYHAFMAVFRQMHNLKTVNGYSFFGNYPDRPGGSRR